MAIITQIIVLEGTDIPEWQNKLNGKQLTIKTYYWGHFMWRIEIK